MYEYTAKLIRVIDADTLDAMVDLGFDVWVKKRIRLFGIDAYEVRTRDAEEKKKGLAAKALVEKVLRKGDEFSLISHGVGKYGRCLGSVYLQKDFIREEKYHGRSINEMLMAEGHAERYDP